MCFFTIWCVPRNLGTKRRNARHHLGTYALLWRARKATYEARHGAERNRAKHLIFFLFLVWCNLAHGLLRSHVLTP
jgi:hypothetical protein